VTCLCATHRRAKNLNDTRLSQREFFLPNSFESEEDVIMNLGNFLFEYNHLRRHGGLNYETPFDKLQKVTELLI